MNFNGFCDYTITFEADDTVKPGVLVKMTDDNTVGACADGDKVCGVCVNVREGYAAVKIAGYAEVAVSGGVSVGYQKLSSADSTSMKTDTDGREYLVVSAGTDTAGIIL